MKLGAQLVEKSVLFFLFDVFDHNHVAILYKLWLGARFVEKKSRSKTSVILSTLVPRNPKKPKAE